jgi:hypothetical protein
MLRHYLTIGGEDVSGFMQSVKLERSDSSARANFVIANIYGMFTGRWKDEGDDKAKVVLLLENERHNCIGDTDLRQSDTPQLIDDKGTVDPSDDIYKIVYQSSDKQIESNSKIYHAFCGYVSKVEYDERYVKLTADTSAEFLEEEVMPDGLKPTGGTAYIATPPAEIILDVISQHKDPTITVKVLSTSEAAAKGYPVLQVQRSKLPGYKPPVPPGGSDALYPVDYDFLSFVDYAKLYPKGDGEKFGWHRGNGFRGPGWYRRHGDTGTGTSPGGGGTGGGLNESRTCLMVCRYKQLHHCCKLIECAYKKTGTLCRQVKCPYDVEKRAVCFTHCPYDTGDCPDSVSTADEFECPTCKGTGSSPVGGTCSTCGGSGYSTNQVVNAALKNAEQRLSKALNDLKEAQARLQMAQTDYDRRRAQYEVDYLQREALDAKADYDRLDQFHELPIDEESLPLAVDFDTLHPDFSGLPDELVYIDFWNPNIIKDQVQGVKGVKYADVIRAVQRSTGGQFYVDEECKAKFIPPNFVVPSTESTIDITHLVTKQGLGKSAMGHANIVVVYGSGITEPGQSPVERERHKVIGFLQENTDSIQRHGTIHASEVDVHYLPKQSQVEELAGNLIEYYRGDDDKAEVEAIGILPLIYQKVQWKVPIGPRMDTENCQFGSTAIMAVVSGRVNKVTLDYSTKGWTVNLEVSTTDDPMSTAKAATKSFVIPAGSDYAFSDRDTYSKLVREQDKNWNTMNNKELISEGTPSTVPMFNPNAGDVLYVKLSSDGKSLELASELGDSFGKPGDKPARAFALMWTGDSSLIQKGNAVELMSRSKA